MRVFEYEPELLHGLDPISTEAARRAGLADTLAVPPGAWHVEHVLSPDEPLLGLLVLDGLLIQELAIDDVETADIAGPGDLLRPFKHYGQPHDLTYDGHWKALTSVTVAVLDRRFAATIGRWPDVIAGFVGRALQRSRQTGFLLALAQPSRLEDRITMLFWYLADRWGRVTADGVKVELGLTHDLIARLVSARRPSVTRTLRSLQAERRLLRVEGGWFITGRRPHKSVGEQVMERPLGASALPALRNRDPDTETRAPIVGAQLP